MDNKNLILKGEKMDSNRNARDFRRLLRDRRRLAAFATGRPDKEDKELERLAGLLDQPDLPEDLLILAIRPQIIC